MSYICLNNKNYFYYVISGENAAELDSIIQISLDLQEAQKARGNIQILIFKIYLFFITLYIFK